MISYLTSILFIIPYVLLLLYYRKAWIKIPSFVPGDMGSESLPFVSVIISARNEEENIADCIHSLMSQSYLSSKYEVIVINDHSEDNTAEIVRDFSGRYHNLKLVQLSDYLKDEVLNSYKKKAIETGISVSAGELIMTTDADCIVPENWIYTVVSYYRQHRSAMIASPVNIAMPLNTGWMQKFFYIFQILDFTTLQGITGAALFRRFHYMANGANLAYPRSIFMQVKGYSHADELASGDDMFLMEKVRMLKPDKIHYLKSTFSTVITYPEQTIKDFLNQRIRWASKSSAYRDYKIKMVLALVYAVNVWCFVLLFKSIFLHNYWEMICFFSLKILFELIFLLPVTRFFNQQRLLPWFVLLQPLHVFYIIIAGWMGGLGSYTWKGRKVK